MKIRILIPTFNESESILTLLEKLTKVVINGVEIDILVIDDGSPDGTADLVQDQNYSNVKIMRRPAKSGLGPSYLAGIRESMQDASITHLVSMDGDGSHRVIDLITLIDNAILQPDALILGSRWVSGGEITNWPNYRKLISKVGSSYARKALKLPIADITGGFKIYPISVLRKLDLSKIQSNGYCFQIEMAMACQQSGCQIIEVPINFVERLAGRSKMSGAIALEAMVQVSRWGLALRTGYNADKLHYVK